MEKVTRLFRGAMLATVIVPFAGLLTLPTTQSVSAADYGVKISHGAQVLSNIDGTVTFAGGTVKQTKTADGQVNLYLNGVTLNQNGDGTSIASTGNQQTHLYFQGDKPSVVEGALQGITAVTGTASLLGGSRDALAVYAEDMPGMASVMQLEGNFAKPVTLTHKEGSKTVPTITLGKDDGTRLNQLILAGKATDSAIGGDAIIYNPERVLSGNLDKIVGATSWRVDYDQNDTDWSDAANYSTRPLSLKGPNGETATRIEVSSLPLLFKANNLAVVNATKLATDTINPTDLYTAGNGQPVTVSLSQNGTDYTNFNGGQLAAGEYDVKVSQPANVDKGVFGSEATGQLVVQTAPTPAPNNGGGTTPTPTPAPSTPVTPTVVAPTATPVTPVVPTVVFVSTPAATTTATQTATPAKQVPAAANATLHHGSVNDPLHGPLEVDMPVKSKTTAKAPAKEAKHENAFLKRAAGLSTQAVVAIWSVAVLVFVGLVYLGMRWVKQAQVVEVNDDTEEK